MEADARRQDTRKAMAYDLKRIIDKDPAGKTYTLDEVKAPIATYIETANQK